MNHSRLRLFISVLARLHDSTQYSHPEVFTDITVGSNPGCESTGFVNAKGWDPVSGWG